jgi:RimJ/RimL family protein N-acetyltransferase
MISGKKVVLRRVEPADYPDIQRWQNDPEVFRWMDYEHPFSLEDIRRSEERAVADGHPFLVTLDGRGVGRIGLNNLRARDEMASFYVFVGERDVKGQGVGLDATMAMLKFGFDVLNLRKIELWTLADNERALKMYKTAGFVEDARLPERSFHDGHYVDHVVMSVDRAAFERARERYGI